MSMLDLPRVPEPEVMDDSGEVDAYSSAAAEAYLGKIDDSFVEHVLRLIGSAQPGQAIDIGCGPGQILRKLAVRLPEWKFIGVDRSHSMLQSGRKSNAECSSHSREANSLSAGRGDKLCFVLGDANFLPFADCSFDLVLCNSVLHHMANPWRLLSEIRRVAKPAAALFLRDLRRPSRLTYSFHVRWHGRHYEGLMYKLYCDSVRAAYTVEELSAMLASAGIPGARVFTYGRTHLGIERASGLAG